MYHVTVYGWRQVKSKTRHGSPASKNQSLTSSEVDKIHDAVAQLKLAIEQMGFTEVTLIYGYSDKDKYYTGSQGNDLTALGLCELSRYNILNDLND